MRMEELFIRASEIEELLGVSKSMSYKLIHELNEELKAKGYKTLNGKLSRKYFMERFYGLNEAM